MKNEILNSLKKYEQRPYYTAKLQAQACFYEILLNDIPVFSYGTAGGMSNEVPLNNYILKSGKQSLKIKLTPVSDVAELSTEVDFSIELGFNMVMGEKDLGPFTSLGKFDLPQKIRESKLPYFEVTMPFEAKVPWNYGFMLDQAQSLKQHPNIEKLVENRLKSFHNILESRDVSRYHAFIVNSIKKESDVLYRTAQEIEYIEKNSDLSYIKKVFPLPDAYDINFYADGKLVAITNRIKDEDGNRFVIKYSINPMTPTGNDGVGSEDYLYYLPIGKTELEIF